MDTEAMRGLLTECSRAYDKAGFLIKAQGEPFMGPLLRLLGQMVDALEVAEHERKQTMMAVAVAGLKGPNCSNGESAACAGRGSHASQRGACCIAEGEPGANCGPGSSETLQARGGEHGNDA